MSHNKLTLEMLRDLWFEDFDTANRKLLAWDTGLNVRFLNKNGDVEVYDRFTGHIAGTIINNQPMLASSDPEPLQTGDTMSQSGEAMTSGDEENGWTHYPDDGTTDSVRPPFATPTPEYKSPFVHTVKDEEVVVFNDEEVAVVHNLNPLLKFFNAVKDNPDSTFSNLLAFYSGEASESSVPKVQMSDTFYRGWEDNTKKETVASESDERVVNNVMRHEYRVLSDAEKELMRRIKDSGLAFITLLGEVGGRHETGSSRELSIAKTKIEEAVMWAVRDLTA